MNKALIITVLAAVAVVGSVYFMMHHKSEQTNYKMAFESWKRDQGISYGTNTEDEYRLQVFTAYHKKMTAWNANPNKTSTVGLNAFSALTTEEHRKQNTGYKAPLRKSSNKVVILSEENLAAEVDWRSQGAVTPVKNQGQCGSCWSFSTTGSVEGAMFLSTGTLQSFSEQNLVDCSKNGNMGCNGGLMDYAFEYIESHPLMLEADYPYTARNGTCRYQASKGVGKVANYADVSPSANQLKAAIAQQPVSVAIEADQMAFQGYTGGVITSGCGTRLDHGVLAVGYGTENGVDYVLVKNSWGASWGDNGYVKMSFNSCGVTNQPSYPTE